MSDTKLAPSAPKTTFAHRLYTGDFQFDFMAHRRRWYTISAVLLLISVLAVSVRGLNLGIDFVGGSVFQAPVQVTESTVDDFGQAVSATGMADLDTQVNTVGDSTVRIQTRSLDNDEVVTVREAIAEQRQHLLAHSGRRRRTVDRRDDHRVGDLGRIDVANQGVQAVRGPDVANGLLRPVRRSGRRDDRRGHQR